METVETGLVLMLAVASSSMFCRLSPIKLPLPIVQIVAGALLSAVFRFEVQLAPDLFFLLFVPLLLFFDGWRISKRALNRS